MIDMPEPLSTMTLTKKMSLRLDKEHVIEIIKQWAKTQGFSDRADIDIQVDVRSETLYAIDIVEEYQTTS